MPLQMPTFQKYPEPFIDMPKCSVSNNHKDFPNTQFGTMPLNYFWVHQHHFQGDSYTSHKTKSKKYQKLWWSTYKEEPSDQELDHTWQMFSLSKRKMASCAQCKTIAPLINGRRKTAMYPH